jgi:hypothetical protein
VDLTPGISETFTHFKELNFLMYNMWLKAIVTSLSPTHMLLSGDFLGVQPELGLEGWPSSIVDLDLRVLGGIGDLGLGPGGLRGWEAEGGVMGLRLLPHRGWVGWGAVQLGCIQVILQWGREGRQNRPSRLEGLMRLPISPSFLSLH